MKRKKRLARAKKSKLVLSPSVQTANGRTNS